MAHRLPQPPGGAGQLGLQLRHLRPRRPPDHRPVILGSPIGERRVAVEGTGVRCLIGGDGPPLILLHGIGETADTWRWVLPALRAQIGPAGQREVLLDQLSGLATPTFLVCGTRDRVVPYIQARAALARLARGRAVVLRDCGHLPQVEAPDRFLAALGALLRSGSEV